MSGGCGQSSSESNARMASLCFGIASLVLPDSVNENLDWLLYGLMTASLYSGLSRRWGL